MSVFFDHRRRYGDDEQGAVRDRRDDDGTLWGFAYDRIEGVVHLTLAFTIVGGAAVILSSALFSPGAPLGGPVENPAAAQQAALAPGAAREAAAPVAPQEAAPAPAAVKLAPAAPIQQAERAPAASAADPMMDARPLAESAAPAAMASAPEPLAPPSADMREKLVAQRDAAPALPAAPVAEVAAPLAEANANQASASVAEAPASPAQESKPDESKPDESKADEGGRMARCYLKLSGKVQNSGACRVDHAGENVIFHLPGKPLALAHERGRVWTATLGGRTLGKVYKNKGAPCWGGKGFYACENG